MKNTVKVFQHNIYQHGSKIGNIQIVPADNGRWQLQNHQDEVFVQWNGHMFCTSPTGSGKSVVIASKAAMDWNAGISTFIIIPKRSISDSFDQTSEAGFTVDTSIGTFELPLSTITRVTDGGNRSDTIAADLINSCRKGNKSRPPVVRVCCYESFRRAYNKSRSKIDTSKLNVVIDEAHHSSADGRGYNRLGKLVEQLIKDNVNCALFTATNYRADGASIVSDKQSAVFPRYRRTLVQHHKEQLCPNLSLHFRFYDHVKSSSYDSYESESDDLVIDSFDKLIKAYTKEYSKASDRPTLMIIPQKILRRDGTTISAAEVAVELEKALKKKGHSGILNLGGFEADGQAELVSAHESVYKERLSSINKPTTKVVISIKVMDEGVNWVACEVVYMPRVPKSQPLTVQRIGRSTRLKPNKRASSTSDIYFFELGIKQSGSPEITTAMVRTACRLECLFHGLEFKEQHSFGRNPNQLRQKLSNANQHAVNKVMERIKLREIVLHDQNRGDELIKFVIAEFGKIGIELTAVEAISLVVPAEHRQYNRVKLAVDSFIERSQRPTDFDDFCNDPEIKKILDKLKVGGSNSFLKILSGVRSKLSGAISRWNSANNSAEQNKNKLLKLAKGKKPRPSARTKLGQALCSYTHQSHGSYDSDFDTKIRKLAPQWFNRNNTASNKIKLLKLAKGKKPRPSNKTKLCRALASYTCKTSGCYDSDFDAEIRRLAPHWFNRNDTASNKIKLLKLAKGNKKPRPSNKTDLGRALSSYTRQSSRSYDSDFDAHIRKLAPQWFMSTADYNKAELLQLAKRRKPKPEWNTKLGQALSSYTRQSSGCYDSDFDIKIRKLAPQWYISTADHNKIKLLQLARSNKPRPSQKTKLGVALANYTRKSIHNRSYDPVFDAKVRKLAPHWFK